MSMNEAELRIVTNCAAQLHALLRTHESQGKALGIGADEREAKDQLKHQRLMSQSEALNNI